MTATAALPRAALIWGMPPRPRTVRSQRTPARQQRTVWQPCQALLFLGIGVPVFMASLATNVRRLHDLGVSAWGLLWQLIPIVGLVMWVGLQFMPGDALPNLYGNAPKAMSYSAPRGYDAAPD